MLIPVMMENQKSIEVALYFPKKLISTRTSGIHYLALMLIDINIDMFRFRNNNKSPIG